MRTHRLVFIFVAATGCAQESGVRPVLRETMFENLPALVLSNDKLELTVLLHSGAFAKLLRHDDPEKLSPILESRVGRTCGGRLACVFAASLEIPTLCCSRIETN